MNQRLLFLDPDRKKPPYEKLENLPSYFQRRVLVVPSKGKSDYLEFYEEVNAAIFEELGNFGDIFEKSRRFLVEGYCRPDDKEGVVDLEVPEMEAEEEKPNFTISFEESQRRRWERWHKI